MACRRGTGSGSGADLRSVPGGAGRRSGSGLTLVELMVTLAIGLVVVASTGVVMADLVRAAARTLVVTRMDQDLRIASDLMVGELRRAAYWQGAARALANGARPRNPYQAISIGPAGEVLYRRSQDAENDVVDSNESFGFRLRGSTIEYLLGGSGWQAVTDSSVLAVTKLSVTPSASRQWLADACTAACSPGAASATSPTCPSLSLRRFDVAIEAHAVTDPGVVRDVALTVRVRNDALEGAC